MILLPAVLVASTLAAYHVAPEESPGPAAPPAAASTEAAATYYPLHAGATWHYRVTVGDRTVEVVSRVAKIEKIDGVELSRVEAAGPDGKGPATTEHLRATPAGIFRHRYNGLEVDPPLQLVKLPLREGDTWKADLTAGPDKATGTCRVLPAEEITVPAGTYRAMRVKLEMDDGRQQVTTTYWFAEDVGVVRQTVDVGGRTITLELEKYENGR